MRKRTQKREPRDVMRGVTSRLIVVTCVFVCLQTTTVGARKDGSRSGVAIGCWGPESSGGSAARTTQQVRAPLSLRCWHVTRFMSGVCWQRPNPARISDVGHWLQQPRQSHQERAVRPWHPCLSSPPPPHVLLLLQLALLLFTECRKLRRKYPMFCISSFFRSWVWFAQTFKIHTGRYCKYQLLTVHFVHNAHGISWNDTRDYAYGISRNDTSVKRDFFNDVLFRTYINPLNRA